MLTTLSSEVLLKEKETSKDPSQMRNEPAVLLCMTQGNGSNLVLVKTTCCHRSEAH